MIGGTTHLPEDEQDEEEGDELDDERRVRDEEVGRSPQARRQRVASIHVVDYLPRTKTNSAMKARLMKYAASTRPTVRKKIVWSLALRLRLAGDAADQRVTGEAVTDGRADGAAAERKSTGDQRARGLDRGYEFWVCSHISPWDRALLCVGSVRAVCDEHYPWVGTGGAHARSPLSWLSASSRQCASSFGPIAMPKYRIVSRAKMNAWISADEQVEQLPQPTLGSHRM